MRQQRFFGVLNIDKPAGMTSRKVVDRVARLVHPAKAGHAGTLDPLATGVLVVCVGPATRLISFVQQQPKVYRATFILGKRSDTDDVTGDVIDVPVNAASTRQQVEEALPAFRGRIEQVPPQFSAVRVGGRRAYKLARSGKQVDLQPRTVEVYRIELTAFDFPTIQLEIECGAGTYIRAIGRDLGEQLGCGAVMSELARTRVGPFRTEEAARLEELDTETLPRFLLPARTAVEHLPQFTCRQEDLEAIRFGRPIPCTEEIDAAAGELLAVITPKGRLACLAHLQEPEGRLAPKQVFLASG